ncbi:MAG: hypothetical protein H6518_01440 [Microthrixaceae bacterium]|nr:hypothetical protein [Microthrixaceae bacterium]
MALGATVCLVVSLVVLAGPAWASSVRGAPAAAVAAVGQEDGEVSCPGDLDGVPLSLDEEFAGTPRALANDEGVLVRYSLLCPYRRSGGRTAAELTLAWSRYDAEDLNCETLELTTEPAGDGRVQGALDHPSLSARVTYGAASEQLVPAVEDAAEDLLARVPSDTQPCVGGRETGIDATLSSPESTSSASAPLLLALLLLAGTGLVVLVAVLVARRGRRRRAAARAAASADPAADQLAAALRARRASGAPGAGPGPHPPSEPAPGDPRGSVAGAPGPDRAEAEEVLRLAEARKAEVRRLLAHARAEVGLHRAHAEAVRRLVASLRDERRHPEYLASFSGLMALAGAATNLVATTGRRAACLVRDDAVDAESETLERLHHDVISAAERGLGDSRYWLWQQHRLEVGAALGRLEAVVPRLVDAHVRLVERVSELADAHAMAVQDATWARRALDDLDDRDRRADPEPVAAGPGPEPTGAPSGAPPKERPT